MIEWFDDLALGMRFKSDEVSVTKEDMKRFAAEFDPQPFHLSIEETLAGDEEHDFRLRQKINRAQLEYLDRQTDK